MAAIIGHDIKRRVSFKKKIANDFQRQKDIMDIYDLWYGDFRDYEQINKHNVNYDLYNGRLDVRLYDDPVCLNIEGEKIKFEHQSITHYPLISQVAQAMYGELIARPFRPTAKDLGSYSHTLRNKKWNELLRDLIQAQVLNPIRDEITEAYLRQEGITDIFQLTPEQMQQMQADVNNRLAAKTPEEILDFMSNDFQTPTQRQAQQLLDYFVVHQDIKSKQEEGFKHAIITGREIYFVGDRHNEPVFELVNPKYFHWASSQNTEWIQEGTWCKYEQWLTIEEAQQKYAEYLSRKSNKELEGIVEPIGGLRAVGDPNRDFVQNRMMLEISQEHGFLAKKYSDVNYKTKEGQNRLINLYSDIIQKHGANYGYAFSNYGVREVHICWRDKRKLRQITRIINGKEKKFWQDEHYEPTSQDIKVVDVWIDEIWEGTKLGGSGAPDDLYVNIRPIPGQYKSIFNPFGVYLPYVGKNYNTHMNNAKNVSVIDLGKPWQKEFDMTMAQVKHDMATDLGNVFLMSLGLRPDSWTWQQWFDTLRNGKVAMAALQKHGLSNINPDLLRSINLSKSADIVNKIQLLDYFRGNLVNSMNFNETRIGQIGEYTTNQNIQQSQSASYNQTEGYFETHRQIVEKALNMFMNRARLLYKDNHKAHFILDDVARMDLEISPEFWYEEWGIEFTTSSEEIRRVEELRQQMLAFVQNGMSFDGVLALTLANTPNDIVDIMKKENKRQESIRQEQIQIQQQQFQAQIEAEAADKEAERQLKKEIKAAELESQEKRAQIDVDKFRRQNDVDMNFQADTIQKAILEQKIKVLLEEKQMELEKRQQDIDKELKEKELKIKEKEAETKAKQANKPANKK